MILGSKLNLLSRQFNRRLITQMEITRLLRRLPMNSMDKGEAYLIWHAGSDTGKGAGSAGEIGAQEETKHLIAQESTQRQGEQMRRLVEPQEEG